MMSLQFSFEEHYSEIILQFIDAIFLQTGKMLPLCNALFTPNHVTHKLIINFSPKMLL